MAIYVDTPRWNREHGPSGHMVGDSLEELHELARKLDLPAKYFLLFAVVPHYQLPASERAAALAHGAVALKRTAFMREVERIWRSLRYNRIGEATVHRIGDTPPPARRRRKKRRKKASSQLALV